MSRRKDSQVVILVTLFGDGPFEISLEAIEITGS